MKAFFKILEVIWLLTALTCAVISIYFLILKDTDSALYFTFVFIIASIMYLLRKHQRKTQAKISEHNANLKQ